MKCERRRLWFEFGMAVELWVASDQFISAVDKVRQISPRIRLVGRADVDS